MSLDESYVINGDGTTKSAAQISAPDANNEYTYDAMSAVVADKLYIFGGFQVDYRKVSFIFFFQFFIIFQDRQT